MNNYVALYVSHIATLPDDGKGGIRCEVIAEDTDENLNVCIVRRGKTLPDALRKALKVAMISLPSADISGSSGAAH